MKPLKAYLNKEKLKEFYCTYIEVEYSPQPKSVLGYGMSLSNLFIGVVLSSKGFPTIAMIPYTLSITGLLFGLENKINELLDAKDAHIQDLFEAEEREKVSGMEDLIRAVERIDNAYADKLEEKINKNRR